MTKPFFIKFNLKIKTNKIIFKNHFLKFILNLLIYSQNRLFYFVIFDSVN